MYRNISAPLLTKNKYSAIIQTEHKNGGAQWLRLYPIPDSDNADGGSFKNKTAYSLIVFSMRDFLKPSPE